LVGTREGRKEKQHLIVNSRVGRVNSCLYHFMSFLDWIKIHSLPLQTEASTIQQCHQSCIVLFGTRKSAWIFDEQSKLM